MAGLDQIPLLLSKKIQELVKQVIPSISQITEKIGIENLGQINEKIPDTCLSPSELQKILTLRNNILDKINNVSQNIQTLSSPITSLNTFVNNASKTLDDISNARKIANTAMAFIPSPIPGVPGSLPAAVNNLKDSIDLLNPQINLAKNNINSISTILDYCNSVLYKLIKLLKSIDVYLTKCKTTGDITPLNNHLSNIVKDYNQVQETPNTTQIYKGFILDIITVPFSPTVNRIQVVAKNTQNITLLHTPLSFTTNAQTLISEIKLIIDNSNLKAD